MKNLLFAALTLCAIGLYSCGSSCDAEDLAKDGIELSELAYSTGDTTAAACEEYSDKLQSIVDDYGDCDDETIKPAVDIYKAVLADLEC